MLNKKFRLTKKKDFDNVYKNGEVIFSSLVIVKKTPNQLDYSRYGIVVSNKVSKLATQRNSYKRKIREWIREINKKQKKSFDIVIIVKRKITKEDKNKIVKLIENKK